MDRLVALLLVSFTVIAAPSGGAAASSSLESRAREFVTIWSEGAHEEAARSFDPTMREAMPPAMLAQAWEGLVGRMGEFHGIAETRKETLEEHVHVLVTCRLEKGFVDIKLVYDAEGRIAGLWFLPGQAPSDGDGEGPPYAAPPYVERGAFTEVDVEIGAGEWALPGTLSLPNGPGPFPGVVLVHGSGPNDRDETIGPNRPFRDLAWGLASRGIAVLRYDKRTLAHGRRMLAIVDSLTVDEETVDDAILAAKRLAGTERIDPDRIHVLGHSLGGMLAPRIGARHPDLAGLIVLAGAARPLEDLVLEQHRYIFALDGALDASEQAQLDSLAAQAARVKDPALARDTPSSRLPLGLSAAYWLDLRSYDPVATAGTLAMPMLILQGERDYQVTMADHERWLTLAPFPRVTLRSFPRLNHLFMAGEGRSTPGEYAAAGHVAVAVIDTISAWIADR